MDPSNGPGSVSSLDILAVWAVAVAVAVFCACITSTWLPMLLREVSILAKAAFNAADPCTCYSFSFSLTSFVILTTLTFLKYRSTGTSFPFSLV